MKYWLYLAAKLIGASAIFYLLLPRSTTWSRRRPHRSMDRSNRSSTICAQLLLYFLSGSLGPA